MLRPNQIFVIEKRAGNDVYGQPVQGVRSRERGSIVKFPTTDVKSAVRADSSASRGNAHEFQADAVVLLTNKTVATLHDFLIIRGFTLRIMMIHPRWSAAGLLDHYECELKIWELPS